MSDLSKLERVHTKLIGMHRLSLYRHPDNVKEAMYRQGLSSAINAVAQELGRK